MTQTEPSRTDFLKTVRPQTIEGIKSLAKKNKKETGEPHHACLEQAAKQAGFRNYRDALVSNTGT